MLADSWCFPNKSRPSNRWSKDVRLVRTPLVVRHFTQVLAETRPQVLIGNLYRPYDPHRHGETAAKQAAAIVDTSTSRAQLLLLECPAGFSRTPARKDRLRPALEQARCFVRECHPVRHGRRSAHRETVGLRGCNQAVPKQLPRTAAGEAGQVEPSRTTRGTANPP